MKNFRQQTERNHTSQIALENRRKFTIDTDNFNNNNNNNNKQESLKIINKNQSIYKQESLKTINNNQSMHQPLFNDESLKLEALEMNHEKITFI